MNRALLAAALAAYAITAGAAPLCWTIGSSGSYGSPGADGQCPSESVAYDGPVCYDDQGPSASYDLLMTWDAALGAPRCITEAEHLARRQTECRARLRQAYADRWSDPTLGYSALDVAAAGQYPLPDRLACYTADIATFDAALSADLSAVAGMDLATARQCAPESLPAARKDEEATQCAE